MMKFISKFDYCKLMKLADKMMIPLVIINIAAIGSVFYKQGKLDAIAEIESAKKD